ncbi:hypothetical protein BLNAU_18505 [Blattamonas nauphoetae]|uniref:Uncharacterized protein n=1 Tax=Blattamonas nauphoetae TaxID=2049346 RepID=A0ABQ9X491_9EUKA|nr:hypothetical protein BLNAU_18505 [Blattamonas nauphoetae]
MQSLFLTHIHAASPSFQLSLPSTPAPVSLTADPDVIPVVFSIMSFGCGKETDAEANDAVLSLAESERPPIPTFHPSTLTPAQHAILEE